MFAAKHAKRHAAAKSATHYSNLTWSGDLNSKTSYGFKHHAKSGTNTWYKSTDDKGEYYHHVPASKLSTQARCYALQSARQPPLKACHPRKRSPSPKKKKPVTSAPKKVYSGPELDRSSFVIWTGISAAGARYSYRRSWNTGRHAFYRREGSYLIRVPSARVDKEVVKAAKKAAKAHAKRR